MGGGVDRVHLHPAACNRDGVFRERHHGRHAWRAADALQRQARHCVLLLLCMLLLHCRRRGRCSLLLGLRRGRSMLLRHRWCTGRLRCVLLRRLVRRGANGADCPCRGQRVESVAERCCFVVLHVGIRALVGRLVVLLVVGAHHLGVGGHLCVLLWQEASSKRRRLVWQCPWRGRGFFLRLRVLWLLRCNSRGRERALGAPLRGSARGLRHGSWSA